MFYMNPKFKYQFFSPGVVPTPSYPPEEDPAIPSIDNNEPSKRNLVGALKALYVAYGGEEEVSNNIVDIIYKIAKVIKPTSDDELHGGTPVEPDNPGSGETK
jgi:hypothetical protein